MSQMRRLMGIDHGEVRIGVALSDPLGMFASPHTIITHSTREEDLAALARIAHSEGVVKIVIGLPTDSEGRIGHQAARVVEWARAFAEVVGVPIVFWDESYSSAGAAEVLQSTGKRRRRGEPLDDVAAAAILQEYLDAGGSEREPGRPLEDLEDLS